MIILLVFGLICAAAGAWLLFDFFLWQFTGKVVPGTIDSDIDGKLIMTFEADEGRKLRLPAERIMNMGYLLRRSHEAGEVFNVIYRDGEKMQVRLFGYLYLVGGAGLFLPLLMYLAFSGDRGWMESQVSFVLVFMVLFVGGWVCLKLIRGNY